MSRQRQFLRAGPSFLAICILVYCSYSGFNLYDYYQPSIIKIAANETTTVTLVSVDPTVVVNISNKTVVTGESTSPLQYMYGEGPIRLYSRVSEQQLQTFCRVPEHHKSRVKAQKTFSQNGFLMVKIEKSASTSSASVHTRLAHRILGGGEVCKNRGATHLWSSRLLVYNWCKSFECIERNQTFLWTMLREPSKRIVSELFHMSKIKRNATDTGMIQYFRASGDSYWDKLTGKNPKLSRRNTPSLVQNMLDTMNFIGITERFSDSVCVLGLLLNADPSDLAYFSVKTSGQYLLKAKGDTCSKNPKSFVPPNVKTFFESDEWAKQTAYSRELYLAANRSLDATIDLVIGRQEFLSYRQEFDKAQELAQTHCESEVQLPCSTTGVPQPQEARQSCYMTDVGCGYKCLNRIFSNRTSRWSG